MTWRLELPPAPAGNVMNMIDTHRPAGVVGQRTGHQQAVAVACVKAICESAALAPRLLVVEISGHAKEYTDGPDAPDEEYLTITVRTKPATPAGG